MKSVASNHDETMRAMDIPDTPIGILLVGGKIIGPEIAFRDVEQNILRFNPNRGRHPSGLRLAKYLRRFRPGPNFFTSLLDPGKVEHVGSNLWYPVQHTY